MSNLVKVQLGRNLLILYEGELRENLPPEIILKGLERGKSLQQAQFLQQNRLERQERERRAERV